MARAAGVRATRPATRTPSRNEQPTTTWTLAPIGTPFLATIIVPFAPVAFGSPSRSISGFSCSEVVCRPPTISMSPTIVCCTLCGCFVLPDWDPDSSETWANQFRAREKSIRPSPTLFVCFDG